MKKIIDFHAVLLILEPNWVYYMTKGFSAIICPNELE